MLVSDKVPAARVVVVVLVVPSPRDMAQRGMHHLENGLSPRSSLSLLASETGTFTTHMNQRSLCPSRTTVGSTSTQGSPCIAVALKAQLGHNKQGGTLLSPFPLLLPCPTQTSSTLILTSTHLWPRNLLPPTRTRTTGLTLKMCRCPCPKGTCASLCPLTAMA